jgi:hypothetical protein
MMLGMKDTGRADNRREAMTINGYWFYFTPPATLVGDSVLIP